MRSTSEPETPRSAFCVPEVQLVLRLEGGLPQVPQTQSQRTVDEVDTLRSQNRLLMRLPVPTKGWQGRLAYDTARNRASGFGGTGVGREEAPTTAAHRVIWETAVLTSANFGLT